MFYPHLAFCTHLDGSELWINTVLNPSGIPWVTAAYANMTSQIHNDKLQRGYSQPTHSLWPVINLPLICSLTQLIIFTEKGWEGDPLLENYRNRWTILEHKSTNIMLFVIAQGMTSAVEFISCRVQNRATPNMGTGGTNGVWMDELLRKSLKARDLHFSFLIRLWKAFASHKTLLRMSPRAVGWDTTSLSYMNSCARSHCSPSLLSTTLSHTHTHTHTRSIRQDETLPVAITHEHMSLANTGSFHVINKGRSMTSDRFIV